MSENFGSDLNAGVRNARLKLALSVVPFVVALILMVWFIGTKVLVSDQVIEETGEILRQEGQPIDKLTVEEFLSLSNTTLDVSPEGRLIVNGELKANGAFILDAIDDPKDAKAGQVFYSKQSKEIKYFDGEQFLTLDNRALESTVCFKGATDCGFLTLEQVNQLLAEQDQATIPLTVDVNTLTNNGVLLGQGTGRIIATGAPGAGQVLIGNASGVPAFTTINGQISVNANGTATINANAVGVSELTSSGVSAGTYGSNIEVPVFTVDADGRITSVTNTTIAAGGIGDLINGGQSGPVVVGTNDATLLNLETNNVVRLSFNGAGQLALPGLNCTGNANGGALTANGSGVISCSDDDGGGTGLANLNGQTGATQNFVDDANVTIVSGGNNHTITWNGTLSVARGGTGSSTANGARTNLGAAASGANSDITSLSGLTTALSILQGGTGATTAGGARTNLGLGSLATLNTVNNSNWSGTDLSVDNGGTGASTFTSNGILYGNGAGAIQATAAGTTGQCLIGNTGSAPTWASCATSAGVGITTLNSQTNASQSFATGAAGTDFTINSSGGTHTFNIPDASNTARGLVTTGAQTIAGIKTFAANMILNGNLSVEGNTTIGNASSDTLTINAGSAGSGIVLASATFQNCVLETNGSGVLTCGTDGGDGVGIASLNGQTGGTQTFVNDTNITISSSLDTHTLGWSGQLSIARGGTNTNATPTAGGVSYGTGTAYAFTTAGTGGNCLISNGSGAPTWGSCAGGGSGVTLQAAYNNGNTISTTDGSDINFVLNNTATDPNFLVNIASGAGGRIAFQNNSADVLRADSNGLDLLDVDIADFTGATVTFDNGEIIETELAQDSIDDSEIEDNSLTASSLATNSVDSDEIAASAVGSSELASTTVTAASYGSASTVATFTVDADGRLTAAADASIAIAGTQITSGTINDGRLSANVSLLGSTIDLGSAEVTSTVAVGNGGTGLTSYTAGDLLYASAATTLARVAIGSANECLVVSGGLPTWGSCLGGGGISSLNGLSAGSQTFANDTNVTISSAGSTHTLGWNGTLAIARGGTGAATAQGAINAISGLTTNGDLLYHNGTNATRLPKGSDNQCLLSNTTTIIWGSCTAGGGGFTNLNLDADTGTLEVLNDTDTITIAGGTNASTAVSATDTVTVSVVDNPTFAGLVTANGGLTVQAGDTFTFNGDAFTDLTGTGLQIISGSLEATLGTSIAGSEIVDGTIEAIDMESTNVAGAGTDNYVLTYDNATGGFTWVDPTSVGVSSSFDITDGTNTQTIVNGNVLTFTGGTNVNAVVSATDTLTISLINNPTFSGLMTLNGGLTVEAGDTFTFNSDAITDLTGTGIVNNGGALEAALGIAIDTTEITNGTILFADLGQNSCGNNDIIKWNGSAWACAVDATGSGTNTFATFDAPAGTDPVADSTTDILTLANGSGITITGDGTTDTLTIAAVLGADIDLASAEVTGILPVANGGTGANNASGARSNLGAAASGANSDITSLTALTAITPSAALTIGATGQGLTLQGSGATTITATDSGFTTTLGFVAPTANATINFPALAAGTYQVCTSSGNCLGGAGGGANTALSNLTGVAINTSLLTGNTSVDLGSDAAAFRDAYLSGALILEGTTANGFEITLSVQDPTADVTYRFADAAAGTYDVCTTVGNCVGGAGGAPNNAAYITVGNNATLSGERAITAGTNLSATDGGADSTYTLNVVNNPTFSGLITANGGLTVEAGDTFTFNGDAFTDLTGTGLQISAGSLQTTLGTSIQDAEVDDDITIGASGSVDDGALSANVSLLGAAIDLASEITGTLGVADGGTGANSFTSNGVLYGNGTGALGVTGAGTTGQCLVATTGSAPSWGTCAGTGSGVTLQAAYNNGNSILATTGRDIEIDLPDVATDPNFIIDIATGSGSKFAVQFNSSDLLRVDSAGVDLLDVDTADFSGATVTFDNDEIVDAEVSDTLTASNFVGSGSSTNAVDLATAEVSGTLAVTNGGTGAASFTSNGVLFGNGTSALGVTAAGTNGQCLVATTGGAPSWGSCAGTGSGVTLQSAYDNGNTILTTDARNISFTLADTATDPNFLVNIASGSGGRFAVQNNGTDVLGVTSTGITASASLTVSSGNNLTLANNTSCINLKTNGTGVVSCGANENTYVVAASDSINTAAANYVADGTNDETEIESAINAANAAGGGTVLLLEGTYNISTSIDLHDDVALIGAGQDATILFVPNSTNSAFNVITVSGDDNVRLSGFTVDGNNAGNTTDNLAGILVGTSSVATTIDNVTLRNNGTSGVDFNSSIRGKIRDSILSSNLDEGVNVASGDVLIEGNSFTGNGTGSLTDGGVYINANSARVVNNHFDGENPGTLSAVIMVGSGRSSLIEGNYIENTVSGPDIMTQGDNTSITGNTVNNSVDNAIEVSSVATGTSITGNAVYDAGGSGIYADGSVTTVSGNTIEVAAAYGIYVGANQITVVGNTINTTTSMGIYLFSANYNTIADNGIFGAGDDGIQLSGSTNNMISGNSIRSGADIGVNVNNTSHYNTIMGNQFYDNGAATAADALVLSGDNNRIIGNHFYDSSGTSDYISTSAGGDNNYIADNTFQTGTFSLTINDGGANSIFANQLDSSGNLELQAGDSGIVEILSSTSITGTLTVSSLGAADTSTYVCRNSSNQLATCTSTPLTSSLTDNIADAFDLQEGTNNYININTTNSSENISFGNATTNPSYSFLGSGTVSVAGALNVTGLINGIATAQDYIQFQNGGGNKIIETSGNGSGNTQSLAINTGVSGGAAASSGAINIITGNGTGTGTNSGSITIDVGTATGTEGTISLGSTSASALTIGNSGAALSVLGSSGSSFALNGVNVSAAEFNVLDAGIELGDLTTQGTASDEFCLTSETGGGALLAWQSCGSGVTLDVAYDNFGATASKITVDAAESQTGGLEFESTGANHMFFDLQGTGDFFIQDAGTAVFTVDDSGNTTVNGNLTIQSPASGSRVIAAAFDQDYSGSGAATYFQTVTTNGNTYLHVVPNGTGTTSGIELHDTGFDTDERGIIQFVDGSGLQLMATNSLSNSGGSITLITKPGAGGSNTNRQVIDENGNVTFNPTGTDSDFSIQGDTNANLFYVDASTDRIGIGDNTPAALLTVGASDAFQVDGSGNITTGGTLAVNGDSITADGALTVNSTSYVRIGDTSTPGIANGDDDLYVESDLEIDGGLIVGADVAITDITGSGLTISSNALTVDDTTATGFFRNGGNSFAGTATLGTNDSNSLVFETNNASQMTLAVGGALTLQNSANSNAALQVKQLDGSNVLTVDSTDEQVIIGDIAATTNTSALVIDRTAALLGGSISTGVDLSLTNYTAGGASDYSRINLSNYRGGVGTEADTLAGDILGSINGMGYDGDPTLGAAIQFVAAAEWGTGSDTSDAPTNILFLTAPDTSQTEVERLRIQSSGEVIVNDGMGANSDFIARGDTVANLLFVDASADTVSLGTSTIATTAAQTLSMGNATGAVTLTGSNSSNFILNGITVSAPEFNVLDGGIELGDLVTQGTASDEFCLTSETGGGALLAWQACGATTTLQVAYDNGNTITTTSARDIDITLADTATDSNFDIVVASGSGSAFRIYNNATLAVSYDTTDKFQAHGTGLQSTQIGYRSNATCDTATVVGTLANVTTCGSGDGAVAIGDTATAAHNGIALGRDAVANNSGSIALGVAATTAGFDSSIVLGALATATATNQLVIGGDTVPISNVYIGEGVTNATPSSTVINATGGSGSNIAGANLTLAGGRSTGSAAGGSLIFQTSAAGGAGASLNALTTQLTIDSTGLATFTGDLRVNGGDITTAAGDLTIAPAGNDTNITGNLDVSGGVVAGTANEFSASGSGIDYFGNSSSALRVGRQAGIAYFGVDTSASTSNGSVYIMSSAADAGTTTKSSSSLVLQGSYYNGASNFNDFTLQTVITGTGANDYRLALTNTANAELLSVSSSGVFTFNTGAYNNCSALETSAGVLTCGTDDNSGATLTLKGAYDNDGDGSDTLIELTSADDSLIFRNPASGGSESTYVLTIDQLNTGAKGGLYVNNEGTDNSLRVTSGGGTEFVVDEDGHVGIGDANPVSELTLVGNMLITPNHSIQFNSYFNGSVDVYHATDSTFQIWHDNTNDQLRIQAAASGTSGNTVSYTDALTVATNGNIVLGQDLAVNGGDITTASGDLTIAPAGSDTNITGNLAVSSTASVTGDLYVGSGASSTSCQTISGYPAGCNTQAGVYQSALSNTSGTHLNIDNTIIASAGSASSANIIVNSNYLGVSSNSNYTGTIKAGQNLSYVYGTGTKSWVLGVYNEILNYGGGTITAATANSNRVDNSTSTSAITEATGTENRVTNGRNTVTSMWGTYNFMQAYGTGSVTNLYGTDTVMDLTSSGTVASAFGARVRSATDTGAGSFTSVAGIAIGDQTVATNNTNLLVGTTTIPSGNFSIYNSSTSNNVFAGNLRVGSTTAPSVALDVTGAANISTNLTVNTNTLFANSSNGRVGIGTASPDANLHVNGSAEDAVTGAILKLTGSATSTTNDQRGANLGIVVSPSASSNRNYFGVDASASSSSANFGASAVLGGVTANTFYTGSATVLSLTAGYFKNSLTSGTGSATNAYGLYVDSATDGSSGTIANNYGLYVAEQTAGTTDYNIYSAGAGSANLMQGTLRVEGTLSTAAVEPITANTYDLGSATLEYDDIYLGDDGIMYFGSAQDTRLTHSAANDRLELVDNGSSNNQGSLFIGNRLGLGYTGFTISDDGNNTNDTITPTSSFYLVDVNEVGNGGTPALQISESGARTGDLLVLINYEDDGTNDDFNITDSNGVLELPTSPILMDYNDALILIYTTDRWVTLSRSDN